MIRSVDELTHSDDKKVYMARFQSGTPGPNPLEIGVTMPEIGVERLARLAQERGRPFRVLIVDDEEWVRDVFRDFCRTTEAFVVDLADCGAEALRKVESGHYDLVTVDLIMPEMSGLEVLSEIKRLRPRTPVVVVTGNATDKVVHEAGLLGACRVLYKPVELRDFIAEVTSALDR